MRFPSLVVRVLAVLTLGLAAVLVQAAGTGRPAAASTGSGARLASDPTGPVFPRTPCPAFPADNVWNTPITGLPVDSPSAAWLIHMAAGSTDLHPDYGPGGGKSTPYGIPWQITPAGQAFVKVRFDYE